MNNEFFKKSTRKQSWIITSNTKFLCAEMFKRGWEKV